MWLQIDQLTREYGSPSNLPFTLFDERTMTSAVLLEVPDGLLILLGDVVPVDNLEERVDERAEVGAVVVVVEVLPHVEREDGWAPHNAPLSCLLIFTLRSCLANGVVDEQRPAAGGACGGTELAFPAFVGAEVRLDAFAKFSRRLAAAVRGHILPEQRV